MNTWDLRSVLTWDDTEGVGSVRIKGHERHLPPNHGTARIARVASILCYWVTQLRHPVIDDCMRPQLMHLRRAISGR